MLDGRLETFSSLNQHKFMMDGRLREKGNPMAKKYIARDPRTGKPIRMDKAAAVDTSYEPVGGPWAALHPSDIMSLAEGTLERQVRWKNDTLTLTRKHGVRGLSHVPQHMILPAHALLLKALEDQEPDVRIAALDVLPEFAVRRSNELFDWLSVLARRRGALGTHRSQCSPFSCRTDLSIRGPLLPRERIALTVKATKSSSVEGVSKPLSKTWPDVVADHVDSLLLEPDVHLRRRAAKMINAIVSRKTSAVWDLVSWALNDEDAQVRKTVAKSLPRLAQQDTRMGTMFAERAIMDVDPDVRLSAIKTIQKLNRGHGRARDLILAGARSSDVRVRRACVDLLPKLMDEDELRALWWTTCSKRKPTRDLLRNSCSTGLTPCWKGLKPKRTLRSLLPWRCPTSTRKFCSLKENVLAWRLDAGAGRTRPQPAEPAEPPRKTPSVEVRRPTQDELMGYHDDDDDFPDDETAFI